MIHKYVEVYVNDIIAKSKKRQDHLEDLRVIFEIMRKFNLKINPKKCVFRVSCDILLGYIISRRGINIDPNKIKFIINMSLLRTIRNLGFYKGNCKK